MPMMGVSLGCGNINVEVDGTMLDRVVQVSCCRLRCYECDTDGDGVLSLLCWWLECYNFDMDVDGVLSKWLVILGNHGRISEKD